MQLLYISHDMTMLSSVIFFIVWTCLSFALPKGMHSVKVDNTNYSTYKQLQPHYDMGPGM